MAETGTLPGLPYRRGINGGRRCMAAVRCPKAEKEREKYFGFSLIHTLQFSTRRQLGNTVPYHTEPRIKRVG